MAKGMSLEEFRNNLEGDAQKKVKELEEKIAVQNNTINALASEKRHFHQTLEVKDKQMNNLFNRCRVYSSPHLCPFCGLRGECGKSMKEYGSLPTKEEAREHLWKSCLETMRQYEEKNPKEHPNCCERDDADDEPSLTNEEWQKNRALDLKNKGYSNARISQAMYISESLVENLLNSKSEKGSNG